MSRRFSPGNIALVTAAVLAMAFLIAPLVVVVAISFTANSILRFPPEGFSFRWYEAIMDNPQFIEALFNSLEIAVIVAVVSTLLGTTTAIGIFRHRFYGRTVLLNLVLSPLMLPQLILAISLLIWLSQLGLTGSILAMLIAHVIVTLPFVVRLVLVSLERVDPNIERAAQISGASPLTVFLKVTIRLIFPGMFAGAAFAFIMSFDNIVVSLFFTTPRLMTLPVEIYAYLENADDPLITSVSAVVIFMIVAMLIVIEKTVGFSNSFASVEKG
ncbi:MAG: ABC transporter permease [Rhodospirillales bacterium]